MLSHSPAPSPSRGDVVVVALAARSLAAAARRAGYAPIALDLFGDDDTRSLAAASIALRRRGGLAFDEADLLDQLRRWARDDTPVVVGAGFDGTPDLLERMARIGQFVGTGGHTLALLKEPASFMQLLSKLGIPHPATYTHTPPAGTATVEKRIGGSGGWHVRPARKVRGKSWYLQQFVDGRTVSALFLGNGAEARLLGFSEQWCAPIETAPFRYGGAVGPIRIAADIAHAIEQSLAALVEATGLRGLASADFVLRADGGWTLLEINPRPGASLDVFDHPPLPPLFGLHIDACEGRLPSSRDTARLSPISPVEGDREPTVRAAGVVYAAAPVEWQLDPVPDWVADRPQQSTRIKTGWPICTVFATGRTPAAARTQLAERTDVVLRALDAGQKAEKAGEPCP